MKNIFFACMQCVLCLVIAGRSEAQSVPEWTRGINALPDSAYVFPVRALNDATNHVLVLSFYHKPLGLGVFENKIYLNKFSETGVLNWSLIYDNNGTGQPRGFDMTIDADGNCYIAGGFTEAGEKPLLLKVNASGNTVWQRDSTTSFKNSSFDQVIFQNDRLYLKSYEGIATFDLNGNELWSLGDDMDATYMEVDHAGQIIVSAYPTASNNTIFRYDAAGVLNFSDSTIVAKRITTDFENNLYLLTDFPQYELVKYDSAGNLAWNNTEFPEPPGFGDIGFDVLTDYNNDVTVVGLSDTMFKFTAGGDLIWERPMNGLDSYLLTAKIVFNNFLAVAGTIWSGSSYDMKVVLFNLNGVESWSGYYNSNDIQEFPVDMTIDNSGVYVIEDSVSRTTLVKFSSPFSSGIDYSLVCVDSVWYDPANPILINVRVFNGNVSHLNYPSVQIVSPGGDTISNVNNFVNFFAHLGNTYQVYADTIIVQGIPDFSGYTFLMNEGFGDTTEVIDWCFATGLQEPVGNEISIYPNPVQESLFIQHTGRLNKNYSAVIYSILGRKVFEEILSAESFHSIDVSGFANGVYVLRITDGNLVRQVKFVKQ